MAVKYGLTKEEQEELRAARAQRSAESAQQTQTQNSRYDRTTNRMRYGLSEAEQQYFSGNRSDKRKAEILQANQSAGWRETAYTKAREKTISAYDSYNNLVKDYQALFDNKKLLREDRADQDTIAELLGRAEALSKEGTSGTQRGLKALQESLRSIQARNLMQSTVSAVIPDSVERAIGNAEKKTAKIRAGAAAIPGMPGDSRKWIDAGWKLKTDEAEVPEAAETYTPENVGDYMNRAAYLLSLSEWTDEQKQEAKSIQRAITASPMADSYLKRLGQEDSEEAAVKAKEAFAIAEQLGYRISPFAAAATALGGSFVRGTGLTSLAQAAGAALGIDSWVQEIDRFNQRVNQAASTGTAGKIASGIGGTIGGLTAYQSAAGLAGKAAGAIQGFSTLTPAMQGAAKTAITFMLTDAARGAGDAATGKTNIGDYAESVVESGIGGAVGSVASALVTSGIAQQLTKHNLQTPFMEFLRQLSGGTVFAAASTGTQYAFQDPEERPDAEDVAQQMATAFLFSVINSSISTVQTTRANRARMEAAVQQMEQDYQRMAQGAMSQEEMQRAAERMTQYSSELRSALAQNYYAGQQEYVDQVRSALDVIDDYVTKAAGGTAQAAEPLLLGAGSAAAENAAGGMIVVPTGGGGTAEAEAMTREIQAAVASGLDDANNLRSLEQSAPPAAAEQNLNARAEALYQAFGSTSVQPRTAEQTVEERADALYREFGGKQETAAGTQKPQIAAQETAAQAAQTSRESQREIPGAAKTGQETGRTAQTSRNSAQMTVKTGKAGTSVRGTDVVKAVKIGDNDIVIQKTDGSTASINTLDQRGTALEVLQFAKEMPDYRDTMTVNGMMRAYESYLGNSRGNRSVAERFFDNYVIAVSGGAEGESLADVIGVTTSRRMQAAMEHGWRRGVEIAKGRRASKEMGSAGQAAMEQYGYLYPQMFSDFYRAGQQGATFQQAMEAAGVKSLGEIKKAEMKAAWKAGRKDGTDYEIERYAVSDAGSQRENGLGAGGKAGDLEEGTGGREGREGGRVGRRGGGDAENRTSLKELGVRSGTDAPQNIVSREKNEYGGEIITVSDRLLVRGQDGTERDVQAIQSGSSVILRENDPMLEQHKAHELEHIRQRNMTDEEITAVFREKTKSLSDKKLRRILSAYALDYYGLYGADDTTMADLYREYLADEAAGIRHKETDQDVILPDERDAEMDQRDVIRAMRGNQNGEKPAYAVNREYAAELDAWMRDGMSEGERFELGSTGPVLQGLGAIESDIYINGDKIKTILKIHPEMTIAEIKKIPEILEDPALVLKSRTKGNSIVVFGTYRAQNGKPILAAMDLRPMEKGFVLTDMQKVASAYTKTETRNKTAEENGRDFLQSSDVLFLDKKRAALVLRPMGIYAPMDILRSGYIGSISYSGRYVNTEGVPFSSVVREQGESYSISAPERDSTGRELSTEQAEYFKGSKVRDEDGNLKPVYHGSGAKFTEFSHKFGGSNGSAEGQGFYFTDYKPMAEGYEKKGGQLLEGYLDIKKPLSDSELTLRRNEVMKLVKAIDPTGDDLVINYDPSGMGYPSSAWYNRALRETVNMLMQNETDSELMGEIANAFGDREPVLKAAREQLGYDGYIVDGKYAGATVYVAFDSSQFKNLDNYTPTENRDIRYSVSEEYEPVSSSEYAEIQRRQEKLYDHMVKRQFELRRQMSEGTEKQPTRETVAAVAQEILKITGPNAMSRGMLSERIEQIAMNAARETNRMEAYRKAKEETDLLAADLVRGATGRTEKATRDWDGIRAVFRSGGKPVKLFIDGANRMDLESEGGYEGMRKRLMGYAFLSSGGVPVGDFYKTLAEKYPDYFPDTLNRQADQLIQIAKVLDRFRSIFKSPYEGELATATEYISNEILQKLYNNLTTSPGAEAYAEQHEDMLRAYYQQKIKELKANHQDQVEQMKREYAAKRQQERESQKTAREERTLRTELLHMAQRLSRIKVGSQWKDEADYLIGQLDTISKRMTGCTIVGEYIGNISSEGIEVKEYKKNGKKLVNLVDLKNWVDNMLKENPNFRPDAATMKKLQRLDRKSIDDLTMPQVRNLLNAMSNLEHEIEYSNKLIRTEEKREITVLSSIVRSDIEAAGGVTPASVEKFLSDYITTQSLSPIRFMKRITGYKESDPLYRAALELQRGETKMIDFRRRAEEKFKSFRDNQKFMESLSGKKSEAIEITGRTENGIQTLRITPDMRIAIYLHSRNDDNINHAELGGMLIPDYDLLMRGHTEEAYGNGKVMYLTKRQMQQIANGMKPMERNYANAIWEYYNVFAKEELNAVSRDLIGYDRATVRNYYPIEVGQDYRMGDPTEIPGTPSAANPGNLKERTGAATTINLRGATETLMKSIDMNAKYIGLAIPVRNFGKLYGNTTWFVAYDNNDAGWMQEDEREKQTVVSSVQAVLNRTWGAKAGKYIDKLLKDIQTQSFTEDDYAKGMDKIRSNYAGAVLTLNISVAMKQAASYPTAAAVVGWKALGKAMTNWQKTDLDLMAKYTPLLWYRSKGYSTKELGDLAKGNKSLPKYLNWIQGIDIATTKKLWKAAEYYIRDNQKELTIASEDYYKAVAEVYNRIILETQPNYTTMERPQALRSDSDMVKNMMMFKTQTMQNLNIAYDAIANLRAKERQLKAARDAARNDPAAAERVKDAERAVKEAKRNAANGISALLVSNAVLSTVTLIWNLLLGKMDKYRRDDDETTVGSFLKGFGGDMLSSFAGMIPFGSDVYEVVWSAMTGETYYGMEALTPSAISDFLETVVKIPDNLKEVKGAFDGDVPVGDVVWSVDQLAVAASKLLGIPVENVQNLMKAVSLNVMKKAMTAEEADYWYRYYTTKTTASKRRSQDYADIYDAAKAGNMDGYQEMRDKMEGWIWKENDSYQSGEISRDEAMERATETVDGAMKERIQEEFLDGTMKEEKAKKLLTEIAGFDKDDQKKLDETVLNWACEKDTGIKYDDLRDAYLNGEISGKRAAEYLAKYGWHEADMDEEAITEEAEATVRKWEYQSLSGDSNAGVKQADQYYELAKPAGISMEVYNEFYNWQSKQSSDKDEDGKDIKGQTKKDKVVAYIDGLNLSDDQKDALFLTLYKESGLKDTPWH